jgi:hypothetical protein
MISIQWICSMRTSCCWVFLAAHIILLCCCARCASGLQALHLCANLWSLVAEARQRNEPALLLYYGLLGVRFEWPLCHATTPRLSQPLNQTQQTKLFLKKKRLPLYPKTPFKFLIGFVYLDLI